MKEIDITRGYVYGDALGVLQGYVWVIFDPLNLTRFVRDRVGATAKELVEVQSIHND